MKNFDQTKIRVVLKHRDKEYTPPVIGEVTVEWSRFATPGKMTLTILKDKIVKFEEGDTVRLKINGKKYFYGYIFTYERVGDSQYQLTCYDMLRYLKSSDVFKNKKKSYGVAVKDVCKRYGLKTGKIDKTKHLRKAKVFTGTVFDMLEDYRKDTAKSTGSQYILYADYNRIRLRKQSSMRTNYVINATVARDFSYQSTIDKDTYTVIKLYRKYKKKKKEKYAVYVKTMKKAKKKYGKLVYTDTTDLKGKDKAKIMKRLNKIGKAHDSPRKKLSFTGVFGIPGIRAGSSVMVKLNAAGISRRKRMVVSKVTHHFAEGIHTMDLVVVGGNYVE